MFPPRPNPDLLVIHKSCRPPSPLLSLSNAVGRANYAESPPRWVAMHGSARCSLRLPQDKNSFSTQAEEAPRCPASEAHVANLSFLAFARVQDASAARKRFNSGTSGRKSNTFLQRRNSRRSASKFICPWPKWRWRRRCAREEVQRRACGPCGSTDGWRRTQKGAC